MTWVDTNLLLDIAHAQPGWADWSRDRMAEAAARGPLRINDIVYAEVSASFGRPAELDAFLGLLGIVVGRSPPEALVLAARTHLAYRRRGGQRSGVLPDFFIGADAAVGGGPLLTRDPRRYRTDFPDLILIAPDTGRQTS
ncbi:type II toxin-antitoxin system VapC family toxin [Paracraurococcus ruber]|uniref:DNA-binding protein n=1 Tax=Paracraurococcus ruber TaxID=77675 RepID=A0ABS1D3M9_9PROT|nr:type II toxin-antitoxin system VapC family toxin [Paracraurococcus ruber]MBK1661455.1 DNA-binding protein [Paracraurococcus ruber]TDG27868.1 DNA-binding protein [Paracraurococcus ruber]